MKKKVFYSLFLFITLFLFTMNVKALQYGVVNTAVLRVRDGAGTNHTKVAELTVGNSIDLVNTNLYPDEIGCNGAGWYQITYSGNKTGYVCSLYLDVYEKNNNTTNTNPGTSCEQELASKGFPSSYWSGLCSLKKSHPNWNFESLKTGVDFNAAVTAEASCGKSLMSTSNSNYINYNCPTTDYNGYKTVSSAVVAYYLDPRNFFNDSHIFMFENQYYNNNISNENYTKTITNLYNGYFIYSQIPNLPSLILNGGIASGMNPVAITSRIRQEMGQGKLTSGAYAGQLYSALSGNYTTRYPSKVASDGHSLDNYYNFYNINAYDSSNDMTLGALKYAYSKGWGGTGNKDADRQTAITGGASWIKNRYLDAGQPTGYLQKFNVNPNVKTSLYTNQYMTNIVAPKSEATTIQTAYKNLNMLNSSFTFYIPIFDNMPNSTSLPTNANDKNFNGIGAAVNPGNNNSSVPQTSVETIVSSAGLNIVGSSINKIEPGTSVNDIKRSIENMGGSVTIKNASGAVVTSGNVGTGSTVTVNGVTYTIVIFGDTSGDGKINSLDLLKIQKHILKSSSLNGAYAEAADPSKDGKINSLDLLKVQKHILKSASITQ